MASRKPPSGAHPREGIDALIILLGVPSGVSGGSQVSCHIAESIWKLTGYSAIQDPSLIAEPLSKDRQRGPPPGRGRERWRGLEGPTGVICRESLRNLGLMYPSRLLYPAMGAISTDSPLTGHRNHDPDRLSDSGTRERRGGAL